MVARGRWSGEEECGYKRTIEENSHMYKLDLEKAEESETKLLTYAGSSKMQGNFKKKKSTSASLTMPKPLTAWITTNCGIFLKRWEYQTTSPDS